MKCHGFDVTYCLNMHPCQTLDQVLLALREYLPAVKSELSLDEPLGVGLRLGAPAARELVQNPQKMADFKDLLINSGLYVFTINGFPYGEFNQGVVKENVYFPDWGDPQRLAYTNDLIDILDAILPDFCDFGSISTVPITYGKVLPKNALSMISACGQKLNQTKRSIFLAFEPEPDCFLENTTECLDFFELLQNELKPEEIARLGICLDTCHFAVNFESPLEAWQAFAKAGVNVPKIQVSAALQTHSAKSLSAYAEPTYLHQTRIKQTDGSILAFADLGEALATDCGGEWRVHFHVPIYSQTFQNGLESTVKTMTSEFWSALNQQPMIPHLEVETYTFEVLPQKSYNMVASIAAELKTLRQWLDASQNS